MSDQLLDLPWQIQLTLASGYLAYLTAYSGIRQHHTSTDTVFRTFSFGLVWTGFILLVPLRPIYLEFAGLVATVAAGAFWRWRGMSWAQSLVNFTNVTWSDDIPSAWISITAVGTDVRPSQIAVDLQDGRTLVCDDTRAFASAPFGPCVFGLDGSIALYVTAERRPDGKWIEITDIHDNVDGSRITYVPASAVTRIELRLWTQPNARASTEAGPAEDAAAALAVSVELNPVSK